MVVGHKISKKCDEVLPEGSKEKGRVVSMVILLVEITITISMAVSVLLQGKHVLQLNSVICEPREADLDSLLKSWGACVKLGPGAEGGGLGFHG